MHIIMHINTNSIALRRSSETETIVVKVILCGNITFSFLYIC